MRIRCLKRVKALFMIQLTDDEVALLKSLLVALRSIKIRDIDKALVILAKANRARKP